MAEVVISEFSQEALAVAIGNALFPHAPGAAMTAANLPDLPPDLRACLFAAADAAMAYIAECLTHSGQVAQLVRVDPSGTVQ